MAIKKAPIKIRPAKAPTKAYSIREQKADAPKAEAHPVHHASASDSTLDTLKTWIRKFIMILPFIRNKEMADMILHPDAAIQHEIGTASVKRGYLDYLIPTYFIAIPVLVIYSLIISVFSLGALLPMAAVILFGGMIAVPIVIFLVQFLSSLAIFIAARLLGGKGSFGKMMGVMGTIAGAMVIINLPLAVLSMIPCVGYLFQFISGLVMIYQLYLVYRLNMHLHGLNTKNSIIAIAVPCILLLIVIVALVLAYFGLILGLVMANS